MIRGSRVLLLTALRLDHRFRRYSSTTVKQLQDRSRGRNPLKELPPICDPHFHVWDTTKRPNPNLGPLAQEVPVYTLANHLKEAQDGGLKLVSGVHVEAIVGQCQGGKHGDAFEETREVMDEVSPYRINLVPFLDLQRSDVEQQIQQHRAIAGPRVVGVRMILNYCAKDPSLCWPKVTRGDYLMGGCEEFNKGFAVLAKHGLSFELQCNWFQLHHAANFLKNYPDLVVVVDHLGCLKLGAGEEEDGRRVEEWRRGMQALAALPGVHVKLSMLDYLRPGWQKDEEVKDGIVRPLVQEVVNTFGSSRCMFASNFPVDRFTGPTTMRDLYHDLYGLVSDRSLEDHRALFHDTAARAYKLITPAS